MAFRKGFNTQHALLRLMDACKESLDKRKVAGALLMDLSKAFDCIEHELLIAKLIAYGFSKKESSINDLQLHIWKKTKSKLKWFF